MPSIEIPSSDRGWRRLLSNWSMFWFTPRDPLLLGLMRILTGAVFCYSLIIHTFSLRDFFGPHAWFDLQVAQETVLDQPRQVGPLSGHDNVACIGTTMDEQLDAKDYYDKFGEYPPCPLPQSKREADYCEKFRIQFGFDLRAYHLPPPENDEQYDQAVVYAERWKLPMPPPYAQTDQEVQAIDQYIQRWDVDPRRCYAKGSRVFSVWYHVVDPAWMGVTHAFFLGAAVLFTLGLGTRATSILTWFAAIS